MNTLTVGAAIRFQKKVDSSSGCWLWIGARLKEKGYGRFGIGGKIDYAHRVAFAMAHGRFPLAGKVIDHLCNTTSCVNPDHLVETTQRQNVLRGRGIAAINHRKTHCIRGHRLSGENLRIVGDDSRACRACSSRWSAEQWKRKKEENHNAKKISA